MAARSALTLAFNFKCYTTWLILIYTKIRLSPSAVCPSGPCKNFFAMGMESFWVNFNLIEGRVGEAQNSLYRKKKFAKWKLCHFLE